MECWSIHCPGGLTGKTISIGGLSFTMIDVPLQVVRLDGQRQTVRLTPGSSEFVAEAGDSGAGRLKLFLE
ncbi:MAG: hypothetical protein JJ992_17905 [Planctomycetes bacterium]|nr:hypothetical protein [Planctomycetota bacterium]